VARLLVPTTPPHGKLASCCIACDGNRAPVIRNKEAATDADAVASVIAAR